MKTYSIQNGNYLSKGTYKDPLIFKEGNSAGKNITQGYNVNFSGGLPKEGVAAAKTLGERILTSGWFSKVLMMAEKNQVACNALFALGLAGVLRPATILSLPGKKDREDKIYASGHSIASGLIGYIFSYIFTQPLASGMDRMSKNLQKYTKSKWLHTPGITHTQKYRNIETLVKMGPNLLISIPQAVITIALIPPILKYVFGVQKKPKNNPPQSPANIQNMEFITPKVFEDVKGGLKS